ncbi:hypothetical protein EUGRSUZ_L00806 [Eucalyptus grandis]|uniref:CST complex subunit STN1 n=1 Tax=Eucalyptus grandis TaxID=71139 RepID=A0A058ZUN9_EUCGR|nr:hypothetical protein EUGRSUZ_L00806 [Eucalyptus grandis]
MDKSLSLVYVKLLAFNLLSLAHSPPDTPTFSRDGISLSHAELLSVVVYHEHKPGRFLKFAVDDGTSCVPCILWLNHATSPYFARQRPQARITSYRGVVQITASSVAVKRDPNAEVLHWLDCLKLARRVYGRPRS